MVLCQTQAVFLKKGFLVISISIMFYIFHIWFIPQTKNFLKNLVISMISKVPKKVPGILEEFRQFLQGSKEERSHMCMNVLNMIIIVTGLIKYAPTLTTMLHSSISYTEPHSHIKSESLPPASVHRSPPPVSSSAPPAPHPPPIPSPQ